MSETTVKGLADLQRALDQLPEKIEKNIMRGALRAGAKLLLEDARALCPMGPPSGENARIYGGREGLLRDSIRVKTRSKRGRVTAAVVAGGKDKKGGGAYYAHFVEYGTTPHVIKARAGKLLAIGVSKVNHPGARAKPFMRPALDKNVATSVQAAAEYIRARLASKHGIDVPPPMEDGDE
jgi:HK97 gp10 family phage protein